MDEDEKVEKVFTAVMAVALTILGIIVAILVCGLLYAVGNGLIHAGLGADFLWALAVMVFYLIAKIIYKKIRDDEWLI